jgi:hypothetical protein
MRLMYRRSSLLSHASRSTPRISSQSIAHAVKERFAYVEVHMTGPRPLVKISQRNEWAAVHSRHEVDSASSG